MAGFDRHAPTAEMSELQLPTRRFTARANVVRAFVGADFESDAFNRARPPLRD
jgi:hypothetical protein